MTTAVRTRPLGLPTAEREVPAVTSIGQNMKVGIGLFGSWMLGVGSIIGSMAWLFHTYMIARAGTLAATTAWVVAGLAFLPVTLILAELSSMFPTAGGPYVYKYYALKRLVPGKGELLGFLTGWLFYVCLIAGYACMSNGLVNLLATTIWGSPAASPLWFGPLTIFALFGVATTINLQEVHNVTKLNSAFTVMKFAMAIGFGALAFCCPTSSVSNVLTLANPAGNTNFMANLASVVTLAIGGYAGIELVACASSETVNARKSVPKSMMLTLVSIAIIYAGMCLAVSVASPYVLAPDKASVVIPGTSVSATVPGVVGHLFGGAWGHFATALVVASIVGCAFGGLMAMGRLGYSMALTGLFPKQFSKLDSKTHVPCYSLWFQFGCMCIIGVGANILARAHIFSDAYAFLGETFSFLYIMLVVLYGVSLISLRYTDPLLPRPFRIGGSGNTLAWIMSGFTIALFSYVAFFCTQWVYQLAGLIILGAGIPVYGYYRWRKNA
jgi:amino acid transporter